MSGVLLLAVGLAGASTPGEAVRDAVARHESVSVEDVQVEDILVAGAPADATWVVSLPAAAGLCGRVPVVLTADAHRYAVVAPITTWRDVPIAEKAVASGERLVLGTARVPCTQLRGETPVDPETIWQAGVSIPAGAPVTTARVRPWPDVQKGAAVRIEAVSGVLVVAAPGELLQDGYAGQKVSVLNLATRAVLVGTYAGSNVVTLEAP